MNEDRITGQRAFGMTREKRIEAAAKLIAFPWDKADAEARRLAKARAAAYLTAAFPELMSDPPTGWVAPIYATTAMWQAMENYEANGIVDPWTAARDAHTKEQT